MQKAELEPPSQLKTASVHIPGSKSYTNRALLLAALTPQPVRIKNLLFSDDTEAMLDCLETLGIEVIRSNRDVEVRGSVRDVKDQQVTLNARLSGTTIRFLLALATIIPGEQVLKGEEGLQKRPIGDLVDSLRQLGADIEYLDKEGFPPLRVKSAKLKSREVTVSGEVSSQYLSALLMIAPTIGDVVITIEGEQISKPYVDMTLDSMEQFGVTVKNQDYTQYHVTKTEYSTREYVVEGDFSSAAYFFAIAVLTSSVVAVENLHNNSKQADRKFLDILAKMGAVIQYSSQQITVEGKGVLPLKVSMEDCPDQVQTLAILAAFAKGVTTITGVRSLRVKETERVIAIQNELEKMGIKTKATHDSLTIFGGDPHAAEIATYEDHRMAMSFAVAGAKLKGIVIKDPQVVSKTFPDFWQQLRSIGVVVNGL